jgi:hypothetical protein
MRNGGTPESWKIIPLDPQPVTVHASPDPEGVFQGNPSLLALSSGHLLLGKIYSSNDKGATWQHRADFPFGFARLFRDGESVFALGHKGNLQIVKSQDGGNLWGKPESLTAEDDAGGFFVQGPGQVLAHQGYFYTAFMKTRPSPFKGWPGSILTPVVMRAKTGTNLLSPKSWTFSGPEKTFSEWFPESAYPGFGIPFFATPSADHADPVGGGRFANRIGWEDAHVIPMPPPPHQWHDPNALLLVCRTGVHRSNLAAVLKIRIVADGPPVLEPLSAPSGVPLSLLPWPGGNQKFDVVFDEPSGLFWTVGNRMTNTLNLPARLHARWWGLPHEEASGLQVQFSKNLVDWSMAGLLEQPSWPGPFRTACALAIKGNDLHVVCRGGDETCKKLPSTNLVISYHVPEFRSLAY